MYVRVGMYNVRTYPYVYCMYGPVDTVNTVNDLFWEKRVDSYDNLHFKLFENSLKIIP